MTRESTWLLEYQRDVYSQTGEDGIIEKIFEVIPENDNWCVEFGAWDGLYLTNTRYLIEFKDYSSVLIEADKNKFRNLRKNYAERDNVYTINERVGFKEDDNLDHILVDTPVPLDFDLLSIDIDGNDYHVWKAVSKYRPKVVIIEFNQTIPSHIRFVQPPDISVHQGSSLLSLVELGKEKGYELISVLRFNAFFVKEEYYSLFELETNSPEVLRTDLDAVTYLFSGYDGRVFLRGRCELPWHGIELKESRFQPLPGYFRTYQPYYTLTQKIAFRLYLMITRPGRSLEGFRKRISRLLSFLIPRRFHSTNKVETRRSKK